MSITASRSERDARKRRMPFAKRRVGAGGADAHSAQASRAVCVHAFAHTALYSACSIRCLLCALLLVYWQRMLTSLLLLLRASDENIIIDASIPPPR